MRYPIWEKDDFFLQGDTRIDMNPNVVKLLEKPIPLVWNFKLDEVGDKYGEVGKIRIENGEITGEFTFNEGGPINDESIKGMDVRFGGWYKDVEKRAKKVKDKEDPRETVTSCTLQAVAIVMNAGFPSIHTED